MIACSPPLVNRSDGARTHGCGCGLWIAAVSLLRYHAEFLRWAKVLRSGWSDEALEWLEARQRRSVKWSCPGGSAAGLMGPAPQRVDSPVAGYSHEPPGHPSSLGVVSLSPVPRAQEGVLQHLARELWVAHDPERQGKSPMSAACVVPMSTKASALIMLPRSIHPALTTAHGGDDGLSQDPIRLSQVVHDRCPLS
jgi:hypothetical protein